MIHNLELQSSVFNQYISEIRNCEVQGDRMRFRKNMQRIGQIFAYEISKTLEHELVEVQTPLGSKEMQLAKEFPLICSILRAGIPMHEGILEMFDHSDSGFISAYRKHDEVGNFMICLNYVSCPSIEDKTLILCDPMLATGASMIVTYRELIKNGKPKHTHIVSAIASAAGVDYIKQHIPEEEYTLWVGAIDEELTAQSYIVPGLGDAGDLAFGEKLQH